LIAKSLISGQPGFTLIDAALVDDKLSNDSIEIAQADI